jgi:hypothetical protein
MRDRCWSGVLFTIDYRNSRLARLSTEGKLRKVPRPATRTVTATTTGSASLRRGLIGYAGRGRQLWKDHETVHWRGALRVCTDHDSVGQDITGCEPKPNEIVGRRHAHTPPSGDDTESTPARRRELDAARLHIIRERQCTISLSRWGPATRSSDHVDALPDLTADDTAADTPKRTEYRRFSSSVTCWRLPQGALRKLRSSAR